MRMPAAPPLRLASGGSASPDCSPGSIGCPFSSMVIESSRLTSNRAAESNGGAINAVGAVALTVRGCHIEDNQANEHGGALGFESPADALTIDRSAFLSNSAGGGGGGISIRGAAAVRLERSVVSDNRAVSGDGGGLEVLDNFPASLCIAGITQQVRGVRGARSGRQRRKTAFTHDGGSLLSTARCSPCAFATQEL